MPSASSLAPIFSPNAVAVIGATERPGSVGRTVLENLVRGGFGGALYPVNPKRDSVLNLKAYPAIGAVPGKADLAVIATPAPGVPALVRECAAAGVKGIVILSAGFKEIGAEGAALEAEVLREARLGGVRVIGPNCLGVMAPGSGLNATFAGAMARPGRVGFISQSGALCAAILDWSLRENVGFSAFVSVGSMADVGWGDLIHHLGRDPGTESIVIYMETVGDARAFFSAAREVALSKPILVIKVGRTAAAAKAAASHTGSLTGSDEVLDAAFRRAGVLRVDTIAELFHMAELLAKQPRPKGPRLTILTNAGGPGVLATDLLIGSGGELSELSPETLAAFNRLLPPPWSHGNPVDILGDAGPERFARAVEIAAQDPGSDGLLVILSPQAMTDPAKTAEALQRHARLGGKPILASWMGGGAVEEGKSLLNRAGIPTYDYPDTAARAFQRMWRYSRDLQELYETPALPREYIGNAAAQSAADILIQGARQAGRTVLTEYESKELLRAYGIPTVETRLARNPGDAVAAAEDLGYPVAVKLHSETITHKTEVGGVQLDLGNAAAVRQAWKKIAAAVKARGRERDFLGVTVQPMVATEGYELIVGSSLDPQFGPVLLFGAGGQLVEVLSDRSLALPPLNTTLARRMIERTRIFRALQGVRGRLPVDLAALDGLLVRFGQLVLEQPWIKEIEINPLLAGPQRLLALDARAVLHGLDVAADSLPRPAVRPYPSPYVTSWLLADGTPLTFRPIRPEDEPAMVEFHRNLSDQTVFQRYSGRLMLDQRVAHDRLARVCFSDYDRELVLVAERTGREAKAEILAVGRLSKTPGGDEAELGLLVADPWQGRGIGLELLRRLTHIARDEKIGRIVASFPEKNRAMRRLAEKVGFRLERNPDGPGLLAEFRPSPR